MMRLVEDYAGWLVAVVGGLTALGVLSRWFFKRVRRYGRKVNDAVDTLLGRPAIVHPETGRELSPATPGLGRRLAGIEDAIVTISQTQSELHALSQQVHDLAEQFELHEAASTKERILMWETIGAAVQAEPWDGADRRAGGS